MDQLDQLKPRTKSRIMDIVESVGIDVTTWKESGAANPSYCYRWGFSDPDRSVILLCLWYDDCVSEHSEIFQRWNFREYIRKLETGGGPKASRARQVDELLQDAWRLKMPLRVALLDETDRKKAKKKEGDPGEPDFRELDPMQWHVDHYDWNSGECQLRRGGKKQATEQSADSLTSAVTASDADDKGTGSLNSHFTSPSMDIIGDLIAIVGRSDISTTARDTLVAARVGQGKFRSSLIRIWEGRCSVTGCTELSVLRASHIKAWRHSNDDERLDPANGLLLTANLDALFDVGLISFYDDGRMLIGARLDQLEATRLAVPANLRIPLTDQQKRYMAHHRNFWFPSSQADRKSAWTVHGR